MVVMVKHQNNYRSGLNLISLSFRLLEVSCFFARLSTLKQVYHP
jgi:hypothetical protein